jgi:hypothetical protein
VSSDKNYQKINDSSNPGDAVAFDDNIVPEGKTKGFFQNFIDTIRKEMRDLSYMEIVTATGDVKANVNPDAEMVIIGAKDANLDIRARTRIELDGDIMVMLPTDDKTGETVINKEIMEIHKENVAVAVGNWNSFMTNMFNALTLVMGVTGLSKTDVLHDFQNPLPPPKDSPKS